MKTRRASFLAFLLTLIMVSSCKNGDIPFIRFTYHCPIHATINGTLFISENYTSVLGQTPASFSRYTSFFYFLFQRKLSDGENKVLLTIQAVPDGQIELNKKYPLSTITENNIAHSSFGKVSFTQNEESYEFVSTEGYIVFTEKCQIIDGSEILYGYFEFTAVDSNKNITINVTDGTFENLVG